MKRTLTYFLTICMLAAPILAADTPVVVVTSSGYYVLTQDSAGNLISRKATTILMSDPPSGPDKPGDPDVPTPPVPVDAYMTSLTNTASGIEQPAIAKGLSLLLAELRSQVDRGQMKLTDVRTAMDVGWSTVLIGLDGDDSAWKRVREQVNAEAIRLAQEGRLASAADWSSLLQRTSTALDSATDGAALDLVAIIELIRMVLELWKTLRFGGGK